METQNGVRANRDVCIGSAAALSAVAGFIHLVVAPEHFHEWWGYGTFFLVVGLAQVVYGSGVLARPRPPLLVVGIVGNLAIIAFWAWTRAVGIPLFGPGANEREAVGTIDVISEATEGALIVVLAMLLRSHTAPGRAGSLGKHAHNRV